MGLGSHWSSGERYAFNTFVGWGVTTLFTWLMNRNSSSSSDSESQPQPSDYTSDNSNTLGSTIPVVMGRGLIKSPLISFYGDFDYRPYTEEYGMHSGLSARDLLWYIIFKSLMYLIMPNIVATPAGPGTDEEQGEKNEIILYIILDAILTILMWLFNRHAGRTTIQKGFKYWLGWQNIICWTGPNIGIKRVWMNVYDDEVEESTEQGVWDNDSHVAWKLDNPEGIVAKIDDEDMFGGVDEGGGFVGEIHIDFGTHQQGMHPWMVSQMASSGNVPEELKGLTPVYPMYLTAVIPKSYIGKQATIPEMWFEVVNYPCRLCSAYDDELAGKYNSAMNEIYKTLRKDIDDNGDTNVKTNVKPLVEQMISLINDIKGKSKGIKDSDEPEKLKEEIDSQKNDVKELLNQIKEFMPNTCESGIYQRILDLYEFVRDDAYFPGNIAEDANPANVIYEILKNEYWGCGYSDDRIDLKSLYELGKQCNEEGLGISCVINNQATAGEYITKILRHINGVKYDNPKTGKLTFKLIRNDFEIENLKVFDVSNCSKMEFTRLDWTETQGGINLTYTNAEDKYENGTLIIQDIANSMITHNYTENNADGSYFTTAENAKALANLYLTSSAYPYATINFTCNRDAYDLTIGEPIVVTWKPYGIAQQIFRVTDIDYGSLTGGEIQVTAIEDIFSFEKLEYGDIDSPGWDDPVYPADEITRYMFIEMPYELTRSLDTFVYAMAAKPSNVVKKWCLYRHKPTGYAKVAEKSKFTTVAKFTYGTAETYGIDEVGFEITPLGIDTDDLFDARIKQIEDNPTSFNNKSGQNLMVCDNEIMSYNSIEKLPNGNYQIKGVIRGIFDTLPKKHAYGEGIYFLNETLNVAVNTYSCAEGNTVTEMLEITSASGTTEQDFDEGKVSALTTVRRSEAPSVMNNLKFGADRGTETDYRYNFPSSTQFAHDVIFNFIGRNKFNNYGIISQLDTTAVSKVADTTNNVIEVSTSRFSYKLEEKALDSSGNNVETMNAKWADFCKHAGNYISESNACDFKIYTHDTGKNLDSYDYYAKNVNWAVPRVAGIVPSVGAVQTYANSVAKPTTVVIPETTVSPEYVYTYEIASIILVGTVTSMSTGVLAQNGQRYNIGTECYRIDGYDSVNSKAIIHKVNIEDYYTILSNFTQHDNNYYVGYQYRNGNWENYNFYNV